MQTPLPKCSFHYGTQFALRKRKLRYENVVSVTEKSVDSSCNYNDVNSRKDYRIVNYVDYIQLLCKSTIPWIALNEWMALNSLICADVPLRNCSLTHSLVVRWLKFTDHFNIDNLIIQCFATPKTHIRTRDIADDRSRFPWQKQPGSCCQLARRTVFTNHLTSVRAILKGWLCASWWYCVVFCSVHSSAIRRTPYFRASLKRMVSNVSTRLFALCSM